MCSSPSGKNQSFRGSRARWPGSYSSCPIPRWALSRSSRTLCRPTSRNALGQNSSVSRRFRAAGSSRWLMTLASCSSSTSRGWSHASGPSVTSAGSATGAESWRAPFCGSWALSTSLSSGPGRSERQSLPIPSQRSFGSAISSSPTSFAPLMRISIPTTRKTLQKRRWPGIDRTGKADVALRDLYSRPARSQGRSDEGAGGARRTQPRSGRTALSCCGPAVDAPRKSSSSTHAGSLGKVDATSRPPPGA